MPSGGTYKPENSQVRGPRVQLSASAQRDSKEMQRIQKLSGGMRKRAEGNLRAKRMADRAMRGR